MAWQLLYFFKEVAVKRRFDISSSKTSGDSGPPLMLSPHLIFYFPFQLIYFFPLLASSFEVAILLRKVDSVLQTIPERRTQAVSAFQERVTRIRGEWTPDVWVTLNVRASERLPSICRGPALPHCRPLRETLGRRSPAGSCGMGLHQGSVGGWGSHRSTGPHGRATPHSGGKSLRVQLLANPPQVQINCPCFFNGK